MKRTTDASQRNAKLLNPTSSSYGSRMVNNIVQKFVYFFRFESTAHAMTEWDEACADSNAAGRRKPTKKTYTQATNKHTYMRTHYTHTHSHGVDGILMAKEEKKEDRLYVLSAWMYDGNRSSDLDVAIASYEPHASTIKLCAEHTKLCIRWCFKVVRCRTCSGTFEALDRQQLLET